MVVVVERTVLIQPAATGGAAVQHITVLPLTLVELEHLAKVTMADPVMIAKPQVSPWPQVGAAAQVRLVLLEFLVVLAPEESVYSTVSVVRPYITQVVVVVVGRILQPGLLEPVEEGQEDGVPTVLEEQPKQELLVRPTLVVVGGVAGVIVATTRRAALAAPALLSRAARSRPRRR
jgi:hypothetical protein